MNAPHPGALHRWWHRLPSAVRSPIWPGLLATLAILGLLLAFHQVVRGAVRQGELRRAATAATAEAAWRCGALQGARPRARCLAQLDAAQHGEPALQAGAFAAAAPVAVAGR